MSPSYVLAMVVDNLGIVLAMVGATGSTMVTYIVPGAIYWKLHPTAGRMRHVAALQCLVGCAIVPVALWAILQ